MNSPQKIDAPIRLSTLVFAVFGWSIAGVLIWSFFDGRQLATGISDARFEAWMAAVWAGTKVTLVMLPLGLLAGWLWHRSHLGSTLRTRVDRSPTQIAAYALATTTAWLLLSYTTFGFLDLYRTLFASEMVHQLALAISVPGAAVLIAIFCTWATTPIQRGLQRFGTQSHAAIASAALVIVLLAGWAYSLTLLGASVWQDLAVEHYIPFGVIALFGLSGALLADHRHLRRGVLALAAIVLPFALLSMATESSKDLRLAKVHGNTGTGFITSLTQTSSHQGFAAAESNRGRSAVCYPDAAPARLTDVGRIDDQSPDIIWLTVDAIRWDHTTMGGYERDTTPNIAAHAKNGAVFERAFTPATSTRQTMRSLFTGTFPSMIDPPRGPTWGLTLPDEQHTVAQFLSAAGYHTTALSSEDNIFSPHHGGLRGFNTIDESPVEQKLAQGYSAPKKIDLLIEQLQTVDNPQFLWAHLTEPHQPYRRGPDPIDFGDEPVDLYDAALHFADQQVGRLLDVIAQRQSQHPTYVILTADHGHAFGEHGNRYHGTTVFQEETHVPLIVLGPTIIADRYDTNVPVLDIFSTTFELAGLELPDGTCSQSLADVLRTDSAPQPKPIYMEQVPDYSRPYFSVGFINGNDKLMLEPTADAITLFDLEQDPGETRDLSDEEPERFAENLDALKSFWHQRGMDPQDYWVED